MLGIDNESWIYFFLRRPVENFATFPEKHCDGDPLSGELPA